MTISSRTPEGEPSHCPVCGADVCIEPSLLFGDAPCPNCGHLLWFFRSETDMRIVEHEAAKPVRDRIVEIIAKRLGIGNEQVTGGIGHLLRECAADSLAFVELVMELESASSSMRS